MNNENDFDNVEDWLDFMAAYDYDHKEYEEDEYGN